MGPQPVASKKPSSRARRRAKSSVNAAAATLAAAGPSSAAAAPSAAAAAPSAAAAAASVVPAAAPAAAANGAPYAASSTAAAAASAAAQPAAAVSSQAVAANEAAAPCEATASSVQRRGAFTSGPGESYSDSVQAPRPEEAVAIEGRCSASSGVKKNPLRSVRWGSSNSLLPLVPTPLACRLLEKLLWAYNSRRWGVRPPVLLHGSPGSGKSSYIRWLAQTVGVQRPPVSLFLDQQTEAKDLVGETYTQRLHSL